ncbi:MAG: LysR family transcriptional regulator [Nannocystaceae bacterium]|nr:LysR family transcriptional regulator [Nannocystaceae bacterium]
MEQMTALRVFRHAAELKSFAATARQLGLSPAAVSKNVGELEAHLGVRLFNRTTRRMSLTEAGAQYYERIALVLEDLAQADSAVGAMRQAPRGPLRVSAPMTLTLVCLSSAIPRFLERYPDVSLDLQLDDRRVDIIKEGFDVAIRGSDKLKDSSLIAKKLMTLDHVVCGAPAYFDRFGMPESPADLATHRCIQFSLAGHATRWQFSKGGKTVKVPVRGPYSVTSSLAVLDALRAGFGLSLIPRVYVREDLAQGTLRSVLDTWTSTQINVYAIHPSRRYVPSNVRVFLDFVSEELRS